MGQFENKKILMVGVDNTLISMHNVYVYIYVCNVFIDMEVEMVTQKVRLSATVPKYIIDETDEIASESKISRSQLISECLNKMIQSRKQKLLADGYTAMAEQHKEFASLSKDVAREILPDW